MRKDSSRGHGMTDGHPQARGSFVRHEDGSGGLDRDLAMFPIAGKAERGMQPSQAGTQLEVIRGGRNENKADKEDKEKELVATGVKQAAREMFNVYKEDKGWSIPSMGNAAESVGHFETDFKDLKKRLDELKAAVADAEEIKALEDGLEDMAQSAEERKKVWFDARGEVEMLLDVYFDLVGKDAQAVRDEFPGVELVLSESERTGEYGSPAFAIEDYDIFFTGQGVDGKGQVDARKVGNA
ncbi:MAG: hypothetical protein Q7S66_00785 [bacterium]|nr:hypothetical protein [bacterium]